MGELALVRNHTRGELCVGNFGCRGGLGSTAAFALIAPSTKVRLAIKNKAMSMRSLETPGCLEGLGSLNRPSQEPPPRVTLHFHVSRCFAMILRTALDTYSY